MLISHLGSCPKNLGTPGRKDFCLGARSRVSALIAALALASLIGPAPLQANIGDDLKTLRGRYGGAKDMGNQMLFQYNGYSIRVDFDGSHAAMEVFVRDGSKPDKTDITQDDIDELLAAEGAGHKWTAMVSATGKQAWVRDDKLLVARLTVDNQTQDKYLTIMLNEQ